MESQKGFKIGGLLSVESECLKRGRKKKKMFGFRSWMQSRNWKKERCLFWEEGAEEQNEREASTSAPARDLGTFFSASTHNERDGNLKKATPEIYFLGKRDQLISKGDRIQAFRNFCWASN